MTKEGKERLRQAANKYTQSVSGMVKAIESVVSDLGHITYDFYIGGQFMTRVIKKNSNDYLCVFDTEGNELYAVETMDSDTLFDICIDLSD